MPRGFREQLFQDLRQICQPLGVDIIEELRFGAPDDVTVQVRSATQAAFEVVLYSGGYSEQNDEIGETLDLKLNSLFSRPPYRLVEQVRGDAFGNAYFVDPPGAK